MAARIYSFITRKSRLKVTPLLTKARRWISRSERARKALVRRTSSLANPKQRAEKPTGSTQSGARFALTFDPPCTHSTTPLSNYFLFLLNSDWFSKYNSIQCSIFSRLSRIFSLKNRETKFMAVRRPKEYSSEYRYSKMV